MKRCISVFFLTIVCLLFTAGTGLASDPPVILSDDFSGNLTDNWIPGRSANEGGGTHALSIEDGELVWVQNYDYIESKALFGNNLKIEFEYSAGPSSIQAGEFWVELVALTDAGEYTAGIYRSQYGTQNYHAVNIGRAPSPSDSTVREKILDPLHLETMAPGSPRQGKITFTYRDQQVQMQFENTDQETVTTGWVNTGDFSQTKIRIWGMGGSGGPRYIDNVKIYADSGTDDPGPEPDDDVCLSDDFSGNLTDNWIPGRSANEGGGTHALSIEDGELVWVQNYDYIESKALFGNNLKVEFDYRAGPSSIQAGEFWVELAALTDAGEYTAGIYRSQYGIQNYHAVNIGRAPSPTDSAVKENVLDPLHLETMAPGSPRQGKITFTYRDQQVQMQFENTDQETVTTGWVNTGDFSQTKIRIWGMGGSGGPRYIDNVKVYCGSDPVDPVTVTDHVLTAASPNLAVPAGTHARIYGTSLSNVITLESGAKAELINFPGYNRINMASSSGLFTVSRSGTVVTFQGDDGTLLKIPATMTFQIIDFTDQTGLELCIQDGRVMLNNQVVGSPQSPVTGQ